MAETLDEILQRLFRMVEQCEKANHEKKRLEAAQTRFAELQDPCDKLRKELALAAVAAGKSNERIAGRVGAEMPEWALQQ